MTTINKRLREFADSLVPDEEEAMRVNEIACRVASDIKSQFRRRHIIDRISPGDNCVRKTMVVNRLHVDLFVYINDRFPPFDDVIDDLTTFLQTTHNFKCKTTKFGVDLKVSGVSISLLVARNFLSERLTSHEKKKDCIIQNAEAVAFLCQNFPANFHIPINLFGPSMQEVQIEFERKQSAFVCALTRLALFWFGKLIDVGIEYDQSFLRVIELLAVRAAEREEKTGGNDICSGFYRFLAMFELPLEVDTFWTMFHDYEVSPYRTRNQRPLLLDPCNPFVNLVGGEASNRLSDLWFVAASTYSRLVSAQKTNQMPDVESFLIPEAPCTFL